MNDSVIRTKLRLLLAKEFQCIPRTEIIDELGLRRGQTRIDVAVASNYLYGFEIKSDEDSLKRLPKQVKLYSEVCDYASIVTTYKHLNGVLEITPKWWGVFRAHNDFGPIIISVVRVPTLNPGIRAENVISMLWRDEAITFLEKKKQLTAKIRHGAKRNAWKRIREIATIAEVKKFVLKRLKERTSLRGCWELSQRQARKQLLKTCNVGRNQL